jgi:hypothetical protein
MEGVGSKQRDEERASSIDQIAFPAGSDRSFFKFHRKKFGGLASHQHVVYCWQDGGSGWP